MITHTGKTTMKESNYSSVEISDTGVAALSICNAGSMNILSSDVMADLIRTLHALRADPTVRVLVLRGSGDKAFIGGADIKEMAKLTASTAPAFITCLHDLCEAVRDFPVPVIARLSGWCMGGGLELAAACDIRIASDSAHFAMPEVKIGIPSVIQAVLLSRLIGEGNTRWMLLTGQPIGAAVAEKWGLVNTVVDQAMLDAAVRETVAAILECGPAGIRAQKALLRSWEAPYMTELMRQSIACFAAQFHGDEPRKYMQKFIDRKRS
jgi:enoyl-CoA hydratase